MKQFNPNKPIRWGIIGCGDVTEVKSGPAFQKVDGSELVAVMRRTGEKAADYARRHGVPKWYDDGDALINDDDVDAVYIATPPSSHMEYTIKVAEAGKPVYVEKPMALNASECEAMIAACEKAGVPLWVGYYRRCLPRFEKMREIIQSGQIGEPRAVVIRNFMIQGIQPSARAADSWVVNPEISGGGQFVNLHSHTLDWMDYTFGPVAEVNAIAVNLAGEYKAEDTVSMSLRFESSIFPSSILASGIFAYTTAHKEESVTVYGNSGHVSMSFFALTPVTLTTAEGTQTFDIPDPQHVHQPLVQTIMNELHGGSPCPSTGYTALRTAQVTDIVLAEYRKKS
ncbi:MAG: Gfo/Idh/MocA family oxidoreductase [Chloroflexota bacterium]